MTGAPHPFREALRRREAATEVVMKGLKDIPPERQTVIIAAWCPTENLEALASFLTPGWREKTGPR